MEFEQPWLLRFFDQVDFYEVSAKKLHQNRRDFPKGRYPLNIEETSFDLNVYKQFLTNNQAQIQTFVQKRETAFRTELEHWKKSGLFQFTSQQNLASEMGAEEHLPRDCIAIDSPVAGNVWQILVKQGDTVKQGQALVVLESMKMEIEITAPHSGTIYAINLTESTQVNTGQALLILQQEELKWT